MAVVDFTSFIAKVMRASPRYSKVAHFSLKKFLKGGISFARHLLHNHNRRLTATILSSLLK